MVFIHYFHELYTEINHDHRLTNCAVHTFANSEWRPLSGCDQQETRAVVSFACFLFVPPIFYSLVSRAFITLIVECATAV